MKTRRRVVLAWLGAACVFAAGGTSAQSPKRVWRVGFLSPRRRPADLASDYYGAFPVRMTELGYVEGTNLVIDWRFADGDYERLPGLASQLVQANVDVIMALGPPGALAAQKATTTIPIVFVVSSDPVSTGLVRTLAKPGGNITGLANLAGDLGSKHLELLLSMVPRVSRVGILTNPANPAHATMLKSVQSAAREPAVSIVPAAARTAREIESAFLALASERAGALIVALDPLFIQQGPQIAELAIKHRMPSIFANREYAEAGGLASYGQNQVEIYRRAAELVDKILRGARPGDLPVEQPTRLELVINGRTAKRLGVAIPPAVLIRADSVID